MVEKCEFTVKLVESGRFIPVKDDELIQLWTGVSVCHLWQSKFCAIKGSDDFECERDHLKWTIKKSHFHIASGWQPNGYLLSFLKYP